MKKKGINKKNIICLIIGTLVIFLVLFFTLKTKDNKKIKETLEYLDCTYIKTTTSDEEGFDLDIYASIPNDVVSIEGISNQYYYENLIKYVTSVIKKNKYRIIDEKQNLIIRVRFENGEAKYTINGDNNYFETKKASLSKNEENEKEVEFTIKSNILNQILENNWRRALIKSQLGTIDRSEDDYDCYDNEGYKIKTINLKIYNIVFTNNYTEEIFDGIKTGESNEELIKEYGVPNYIPEDNINIIGYKTKDYYVFFSNGEVSIYRNEEIDEEKNIQFSNLFSEFQNDKNLDNFIEKLTEIYPDYDTYERYEDGLEIRYTLRGMSIRYNNKDKNVLILNSNYKGLINNNTSMEDIKNGNRMPNYVSYEKMNSVFLAELNRTIKTEYK